MFLLILFPVFGIKPVFGQDPTETPTNTPTVTPTYVPIFNPVTSTPINVECPGSQPIGWGTVTPAPMWSMYCLKCVTPMPGGWDWGDNPIGTPTSLGTPTPTPLFKEAEVWFEWPSSSYPYQYIPVDTMHLTNRLNVPYGKLAYVTYYMRESSTEQPYVNTTMYAQYYGVYYLVGMGHTYDPYYAGVKVIGTCRAIDGCLITFENVDYFLENSESFTFYEGSVNVGEGGNLVTGEIDFKVIVYKDHTTSNKQGFNLYVQKSGSYMFLDSSWFNDFIWDYEPISFDPPPPDTFCSEVLPGSVVDPGLGDPDTFEIPIPAIGEGSCFQFLNFTIPLSWLTAVWPDAHDIGLPGWNFCFKPIHFGNLSMFGLSIDLDLIAMALGAIVLIRLITRS